MKHNKNKELLTVKSVNRGDSVNTVTESIEREVKMKKTKRTELARFLEGFGCGVLFYAILWNVISLIFPQL